MSGNENPQHRKNCHPDLEQNKRHRLSLRIVMSSAVADHVAEFT